MMLEVATAAAATVNPNDDLHLVLLSNILQQYVMLSKCQEYHGINSGTGNYKIL